MTYIIFCADAYTKGDFRSDKDKTEIDMDAVEIGVEVRDTQECQESDKETHDGNTHTDIDCDGEGDHLMFNNL